MEWKKEIKPLKTIKVHGLDIILEKEMNAT